MNIRQVLRTYSLLRQLTDDESALLETLRGLSDAERESLVTALQPEKAAGKRAGKRSSSPQREYDHCLRCGTTKRDSSHRDTSSPDYHEFQSSKDIDFCARCKGASYVHLIHHDETLGGYHPFESSKKSSKGGSKSSRGQSISSVIQRTPKVTVNSDGEDDGFCAACNVQIGHNVHHLESLPDYHPFQWKSDAVAHEAGAGE